MVLRAPSATARTAPGTGPSRRPTAGSGRSAWTRWQQRCESFSNDAAARASPMTPVRPRLSAVVIALNEEARLRACLESVAWADEIVVVDAQAQDQTVQIARAFTEHVLVRPWPGFATQKNFALEQANGDWLLSLDADEEASAELRDEIAKVLADAGAADGYAVPRRNVFLGQWIRHGGLYPDWQVRLFRRGRGHFVDRDVHESVEGDGPVVPLSGHLVHRSYEGGSDFFDPANRYSARAGGRL